MPPTKGPLWEFFYAGEKQNSAQYKAYCLACVLHHSPTNISLSADSDKNVDLLKKKDETWFKDGEQLARIMCKKNSDIP
jgi:hypothetical protein